MEQHKASKHPLPVVGQAASVWSEIGHVVAVDENIHADSSGKQYVRYYVTTDRPDWPQGQIPVRRYLKDERNGHE